MTRRAAEKGSARSRRRDWWLLGRRRASSFAAVLAAVGASFASASPAAAAAGPDFFGTNLQTLGAVKPAFQAGVLQQVGAGGLHLARVQIDWRLAEPAAPKPDSKPTAPCPTNPTGHTYTWASSYDGLIRTLATDNVRAVPLFRFTPAWVDASGNGLPANRYCDLGAMMASFAKRYGPGGAFWSQNPGLPKLPTLSYELWNEVNLAEYAWNGDANPEAYAAAAKAIRPVLKAAQPAGVFLGSLAYQENEVPDYVARLGAAGGLSAFDAMGYHPYAPEAVETLRLVRHLRQELADAGHPAMPIYANEAGQEAVVTNPDGSLTPNRAPSAWAHEQFPSDAARAANLAFAGEALAASDCGVDQFLPYSVSGTERDGEKLTEAYMGLFRPQTGAPTQTAQGLFRAAQRWEQRFAPGGPGAPAPLALCGGGASPDASLLPIDATYRGTGQPGCVQVHATYDGNPLEAATLALRTPDGRTVAAQQTNAFGDASSCVPWPEATDDFRAGVEIPNAGRAGGVSCDVAGAGCPVADLVPARFATLSAAEATGQRRTGSPAPGPTPTPPQAPKPLASAWCWTSKAKSVSFTPATTARSATVRISALVRCEKAPKGTRVRFAVLVRSAGSKRERKVRNLWLRNGVERRFTLTGAFKNGHVVVLLHREDHVAGIPNLRDTVTLRVKKPAR